jgi:drug/metabolite transporter (DMT)-like permease
MQARNPNMTPGGGLSGPVEGALYMTAASLGFTFMSVAIREASGELDPLQIAFLRNFFASLAMLPWLAGAGLSALRTERAKLYIARSLVGLVGMLCWFTSLAVLPLADAVALNFTVPLFATVGAALFLGETVRTRRWSATAVGFLGVLVILRPGFEDFAALSLLPIVAAVFMAASVLIVKALSRTEQPAAVVLYMNIMLTPLSLVPALFVWKWPSWYALGLTAFIGGMAAISHIAMTRAYRRADASVVVPFDYTRLPFIALFAFALYGELPDFWTWVGAGVIVASAVYIARREALAARERTVSRVAAEAPTGRDV